MPVYKKVNTSFFKNWSSEMAYVLGFFAADGSMIRNNRGAHFIEFQITDLDILNKIRKAFRSEHKISSRKKNNRCKVAYRLQIGSKEMFEDLADLGFTQAKTKVIRMPEIQDQYKSDFIRGYFDGDGHVSFGSYKTKDRKNPRTILQAGFTSGSKEFLEDLKKSLEEKNIKSFISEKKKEGKNYGYALILSHKSSLALYELMYNNGNCSIYLERKKVKFRKGLKKLGYRISL